MFAVSMATTLPLLHGTYSDGDWEAGSTCSYTDRSLWHLSGACRANYTLYLILYCVIVTAVAFYDLADQVR